MQGISSISEKAFERQSSKPVFFVHIGLPKTATTTIQSFLTFNREALIERGILYPRSIAHSDGHSELHRVLSAVLEPEGVPWLREMGDRWRNKDVTAALIAEVDMVNAGIVILSAESLAFMQRPEALRRALRSFPVRILAYLRRQDSFLASFYNQLVKSTLYAASFEEFLQQHAKDAIELGEYRSSLAMCHYDRLLNLWANAFGRENILPGIYEDYDLPLGILRDFAAKTGIDMAGLAAPDTDTNPALQPPMVPLKRRVNGLLSSESERVACEDLFVTFNDGCGKSILGQDRICGAIARRRSILADYEEGNASVAREYFGGRPFLFHAPNEFDPPLPDFSEGDWQKPHHEAVVRMIAKLVADCSKSASQ